MNFNQLYYVWSISKSGSFSAAAKRLLLNQSTLSIQVKQFETSLGKTLFLRSRHGVTLTDEGRLLFEYCERIFSHAEEMLAFLQGGGDVRALPFRLGVSSSISRDKILELAHHIKTSARGISVRIFSGGNEELQTRIERHMLDLVMSDMDLSARMGKGFRSRLVSSVELYFVASPELRKAMRRFPAGLNRVPLLLRAPGNVVRKEVDYFLHRRGITPAIQAEVDNPDLIRLMAIRGEGAGMMDIRSVKEDIRVGRLALLHDNPVGVREKTWFLSASRLPDRPPIGALIDALMSRFRFKTD